MKYSAEISGSTIDVEINGTEDALVVRRESDEQTATLAKSADRYVLRIGSRSVEGYVLPIEDGYLVIHQGRTYQVVVRDERSRALDQIGGSHRRHHGGAVRAPMPGLVKMVNVKQGDEVQRGQSLVILEAMKMENDLTAPDPGVVKEVRVEPGAKVDQGAVLVVLE